MHSGRPVGAAVASLAGVCIDYRVRTLMRMHKATGQAAVDVSLNSVVTEDAQDGEFTLEDVLTRPQPLSDTETEIRRTAPLTARWRLDGYTQREIGEWFGFSKAYANSLIAKEVRALRETLDVPVTQVPQRTKMVAQPCWDLRTEGESGPATVGRVTEEEAALYAKQAPTSKARTPRHTWIARPFTP